MYRPCLSFVKFICKHFKFLKCCCKWHYFFKKFIYFLFLGCVGSLLLHAGFLWLRRAGATLCCGARASHCGGFSCWGAWALGARASIIVARRLSSCGSRALGRRLSNCGSRAQLLRGMWDLPRPGLEPVSPALAGGFLTTPPPGKPKWHYFSGFIAPARILGQCWIEVLSGHFCLIPVCGQVSFLSASLPAHICISSAVYSPLSTASEDPHTRIRCHVSGLGTLPFLVMLECCKSNAWLSCAGHEAICIVHLLRCVTINEP